MMFDDFFNNKSLLISGGSSGIGKAVALMAREEGAVVGVISNKREEFTAMPSGIICLEADVRNPAAVKNAVDTFAGKCGKIDMLVNCAGVSLWKDFLEMDEQFWDLIYDVNVKGTFLVSQAVARHMVAAGNGIIINVASMSGLKSGMMRASAYASSKWAVVGFSRNLHLELKQYGIKVGCFCPGSTATPLHERAGSPDIDKMLSAEEVARTILFMLYNSKNGHLQLVGQPAFFEEWK